jgi:hypothetical protein
MEGEPRRPFIALPERVRVIVDEREVATAEDYRRAAFPRGGDLVIETRWFEARRHLPMLAFCVLWDVFLVAWYARIFGFDAPARAGAALTVLFAVFPVMHVAIGVGLTYRVLAGLMNRTRVGLRDGALFVRHGPLPWRGGRTLPAGTIRQLFVEERRVPDRRDMPLSYALSALAEGGARVPLVVDLERAEQGLFLEQALEERLGIVDAEVEGEVVPPRSLDGRK